MLCDPYISVSCSLAPQKVRCVFTALRMWTKHYSSCGNRGFTWRTWAHMILWMVIHVWAWDWYGRSSLGSRYDIY